MKYILSSSGRVAKIPMFGKKNLNSYKWFVPFKDYKGNPVGFSFTGKHLLIEGTLYPVFKVNNRVIRNYKTKLHKLTSKGHSVDTAKFMISQGEQN